MRTKELAKFVIARDAVREAKEAGKPKPWTKDAILQQYRFCNVHREDDAVTRWIAENWRGPHSGEVDLWFAMVVARLFNLPSTLAAIGYPVPWRSERTRKQLRAIQARGTNVFNAAYIVSTNGMRMDKVDYVIDVILDPLWEARKLYRPDPKGESFAFYHERLMKARGLGSFMAAQVIADLKYAQPWYNEEFKLPTTQASDWWTFAASGPGSRRGLNRVCRRRVDEHWREDDWRAELAMLLKAITTHLPVQIGSKLHAQDLQNCLCEFDKYERVRLGEGTPKQLYPGRA